MRTLPTVLIMLGAALIVTCHPLPGRAALVVERKPEIPHRPKSETRQADSAAALKSRPHPLRRQSHIPTSQGTAKPGLINLGVGLRVRSDS
jgi:hypothetical protein